MQKIAKPVLRLPKGSHKFGAMLESKIRAEPASIKAFLSQAHTYEEEKFMRVLKGLVLRPRWEIIAETSRLISNSKRVLFSPLDSVMHVDDLANEASDLMLGRNALILRYASTWPHAAHLSRPYQELCSAAALESNPGVKRKHIRTLGVLGNLLPAKEKKKLGSFLISLMSAEQQLWPKLAAIEALTNLFCAKAPIPIAEAAEGSDERLLENAAFKASLIISIISARHSMQDVLNRFLLGDYTAEAKVCTAYLMMSMENSLLKANLLAYLRYVEDTIAELTPFQANPGLEPGGATERLASGNTSIARFYKETRFINDVLAYRELLALQMDGGRC